MTIVDKLSLYTLPLKTLSVGEHQYHFTLDNDFFTAVGGQEVSEGLVGVEVQVDKSNLNVDITFFLYGTLHTPWNRFLESMPLHIDREEQREVTLGE